MDWTNISDGTTTIAPLELIYLLCSTQCDTLNVLSQNINRTIHIYFNIEYLRFNTNLIEILLSSQKGLSNQGVEVEPEKRENKSNIFVTVFLFSSVRSSSVYHGLLHTCRQATFSTFSNSSDSKVLERPNMCYILEKHGIQGYQI